MARMKNTSAHLSIFYLKKNREKRRPLDGAVIASTRDRGFGSLRMTGIKAGKLSEFIISRPMPSQTAVASPIRMERRQMGKSCKNRTCG